MSKKNDSVKNFGGKFDVLVEDKYFINDHVFATQIKKDSVYIKNVIYNDPATIVFWSDGTKTISKCRKPDVYSPETGLVICCMKKLVGSSSVAKLLKDWIPYNEQNIYHDIMITTSDVRKKYKNQ